MLSRYSARMGVLAVVLTFVGACGLLAESWVGTWHVTDTRGGEYDIVLESGGQAHAHGSQNAFGIWSEQDGRAYIVWNTGWKAILFLDKESGKYMKSAFDIDEGFNDTPLTTTPAYKH
ncbi:MAG: hypothetical protein GDA50_05725 [Alphaproteobacteria bacterium GM202ARS2]|nr:hypothetical protein [Alphaproteobacteria bacterium GM202ARS2]